MGILNVSGAVQGNPVCKKAGAKFAALVVPVLALGLCSCDLLDKLNPQKPAENSSQQQKIPLPQHGPQPLPHISSASSMEKKDSGKPAPEKAKPEQAQGAAKSAPADGAAQKLDTQKHDKPQNDGKKAALPLHENTPQKLNAAKKDEVKVKPKPLPAKTDIQNAGKTASSPAAAADMPAEKKSHAGRTKSWTVISGPYLLEETLAADLAKVKKTGITPTVQIGTRKKSPMHRLYLGTYDDRASAQAELDKLKKVTADAFILDHGGKHQVYAGSYLLDSRASSEKERLAASGVAVTMSSADVAIPSKRLLMGVYRDKAAADAAVKKLKDAGIQDVHLHQ